MQTLQRGEYVRPEVADTIQQELAGITLPAELTGQPPFLWGKDPLSWRVAAVGPISIAGKTYLNIDQIVPSWKSDEEVDKNNRQLIAFFKVRFPEYSAVFCGIVVRAHEQATGRGYGTVDEGCSSPAK